MREEIEYCPNCKNIEAHEVINLTMSNGKPWRKGICKRCGQSRALKHNYKFREENGLKQIGFYKTREWLEMRWEVLRKHGFRCKGCGRTTEEVILHVDHIEPRSKRPDLSLDKNNLQVLCEECNLGKSNRHNDNVAQRLSLLTPKPPAGDGERGVSRNDSYEYIGRGPTLSCGQEPT